jgi:transcriptional regulator with XRE-family HTH domain
MTTVGFRLKQERQRLGMSQDDFSAVCGMKRRAQMSYEHDERSPDAEYLRALAEIGVDVQFVVTGIASISTLAKDESELLSGYRGLDIRGKVVALGMIETLKTTPVESKSEKQAQLAHPITGKNAQINSGKRSTNISGNATVKIGRKKKDAL